MAKLSVCVAGGTGWAGSALSKGIYQAEDLDLVSAVSLTDVGEKLGKAIDVDGLDAPIFATAKEALLTNPDVFVDYTSPDIAKAHILAALNHRAHVVVGTSGLTNDDYDEIRQLAEDGNRGVLAVGNFALTAVLLQKFTEMAAKYIPHWEIVETASSMKKDVPSGTVRELANRLGNFREAKLDIPTEVIIGPKESRGARMQGTQIHTLRLPGHVLTIDAVFAMEDERLIIRHDSGSSAQPYVEGALLAIREVGNLVGLHRGLDSVMSF